MALILSSAKVHFQEYLAGSSPLRLLMLITLLSSTVASSFQIFFEQFSACYFLGTTKAVQGHWSMGAFYFCCIVFQQVSVWLDKSTGHMFLIHISNESLLHPIGGFLILDLITSPIFNIHAFHTN